MNMTLEQLRCLQAAAECGSFSAAARRLGKAQSVVSTTISNLEIDLGGNSLIAVRVIRYSPRPVNGYSSKRAVY